MSPTAKTTGPLISNTPDSPKNTKEHLVLVKSNYPAEQFTDKKKYLCSSTLCSSPECIQMAIYITNTVNASELSMLFGMRNTSKTNTRGKKTTYGSKQAMTRTTQTKQTLTSRSKTGYARRKNENPGTTQPVKTHQEHPGNKQLITSHNNSRETEHLKDRKKEVQVKKVNTVNRTEPQAKNKKNGKKKKKKKSTLKKRDRSPIHDVIKKKKKKLTEEVTDVDNKNREEEINVTVGQNQRETWTNLFASVSKHLKTCNEGTEIKPMKFKVLN